MGTCITYSLFISLVFLLDLSGPRDLSGLSGVRGLRGLSVSKCSYRSSLSLYLFVKYCSYCLYFYYCTCLQSWNAVTLFLLPTVDVPTAASVWVVWCSTTASQDTAWPGRGWGRVWTRRERLNGVGLPLCVKVSYVLAAGAALGCQE